MIALLLDAGKNAGELRHDVDPDEFLQLTGFLCRTDAGLDWPQRSRHLLDIVMDGLRSPPA